MAFANLAWSESGRALPGLDDPLLQQYLKGREALIEQESRHRSGKFGSLSAHLCVSGF